jgi:hypothetical protein
MIEFLVRFFQVSGEQAAANQAQVVSAIIAAVSALVALTAAVFVYRQIAVTRSVQREAVARQIYHDYLKLSFTEPMYASGKWRLADPAVPEAVRFEKYEWFVSVMLNAGESILLHVAGEDEWLDTIESQIAYHREYLDSEEFLAEYSTHYSPQLRSRMYKTSDGSDV